VSITTGRASHQRGWGAGGVGSGEVRERDFAAAMVAMVPGAMSEGSRRERIRADVRRTLVTIHDERAGTAEEFAQV
jgi:hypothetical protein